MIQSFELQSILEAIANAGYAIKVDATGEVSPWECFLSKQDECTIPGYGDSMPAAIEDAINKLRTHATKEREQIELRTRQLSELLAGIQTSERLHQYWDKQKKIDTIVVEAANDWIRSIGVDTTPANTDKSDQEWAMQYFLQFPDDHDKDLEYLLREIRWKIDAERKNRELAKTFQSEDDIKDATK